MAFGFCTSFRLVLVDDNVVTRASTGGGRFRSGLGQVCPPNQPTKPHYLFLQQNPWFIKGVYSFLKIQGSMSLFLPKLVDEVGNIDSSTSNSSIASVFVSIAAAEDDMASNAVDGNIHSVRSKSYFCIFDVDVGSWSSRSLEF